MRRLAVAALAAAAALAGAGHAHAATWCGNDEISRNRLPDLEVTAAEQVRVVYAVPSDGADRFLQLASAITSDIESIEAWWLRQDPTRAPRWDRYGFPGCGSRFGSLDLGFLRLPNNSAYYGTDRTPGFRLNGDMSGIDAADSQKTIVYYDGPVRDRSVCGETDYMETNRGGRFGFAYVYINSSCDQAVGVGGSTAHVAAHELLHNLGAVPLGAPHLCSPTDAHVCDDRRDLLYPYVSTGDQVESNILDVGHDDYYGHNGTWFDTQDSDWLTHFPQFPLVVTVTGGGRILEQGYSHRFDCSKGCSVPVDFNAQVSLTPLADRGWVFAGWSGSCAGTTSADCVFSMDGPKSATVTFALAPRTVRVSVTGRGIVTSAPAHISCPGRCAAQFKAGSSVRLRAQAAKGWRFKGWTGACAGRGTCALRADRGRSVRAVFVRV
jgi:Divergent InlB B-repeat domain